MLPFLSAIRASATSVPKSAVSSPDEGLAPLPPTPIEAAGDAVIVWVDEDSDQVKSVLLKRDSSTAQVVAERQGRVFVTPKDLFVLARRRQRITLGDLVEYTRRCHGTQTAEIEVPYFRSLRTGRHIEPWKADISRVNSNSSDYTFEVTIDAAVGSVVFGKTWTTDTACDGYAPIHYGGLFSFDLDRGVEVKMTFPPIALGLLREQARHDIPSGEGVNCGDMEPYRATAEYDEAGVLQGNYEFGTDSAGVGVAAPGCPNPSYRSPFTPPELKRWGRLPAWVAAYMAEHAAKHAFVISKARLRPAIADFARIK